MIRYIALLRGINISGKNKISMKELKKELELLGYLDTIPYRNSGNVIFSSEIEEKNKIKNKIQAMVKTKFNLEVPIFIITVLELEELLKNQPEWWGTENKQIEDNIIFVIPPITYHDVFNAIGSPNEYERIKEYKNNIFWSYDLKNYRKTNWWSKTASTNIRNSITIRTANTMKKILQIGKEKT